MGVLSKNVDTMARLLLSKKVDAIARLLLAQDSGDYDAAREELVVLMEQSAVAKSVGVEEHTYALLGELGLTEETKSFRYAFEALVLLAKEPQRIDCLYRNVYGELASRFGCRWQQVERGIRECVARAFKRAEVELLDYYFGRCNINTSGRVSSGSFLARLSREIRKRVQEGQEC